MSRILLQYAGGEVTLFRYKRQVPIHQATDKLARIASEIFDSWEHGDGDIPAIESGDQMLLLVEGPSSKECFL